MAARRDLLGEIVAVCRVDQPQPRLTTEHWQESLRAYCRELRAWYRSHPGMPALARAEDLTPFASADLLRPDDVLVGLFLDLGLSPQDAYRAWSVTVLQVSGFAEMWDAWHDRPPAGSDPDAWAGVPPNPAAGELPHLRRIEDVSASEPPHVLSESVLTILIAGVTAMM
ncbi:TetR/AcrR family transcriptional regulator C-terminal domain-containing protein [Streptomyces sp. NPDC058330]|uniref:TetR/AcrR family transcriptional regulator C-terminal domain-containing protein n=1 Tax=Streptomyces sp. NPDC058330 TaxID=3346449 RepID=UPI0036EB9B78